MRSPIFIVGPHRSGSTLWHNLLAMAPGVVRFAEPRFIGPKRQRDFGFFLRTQAADLSSDEDVDTMVELCLSRKPFPGLESAFWRFEGIGAAGNPSVRSAIADRIRASDRSVGSICRILVEEIVRGEGGERACMKFPVDVEHIPELVAWFPDCKVLHITRDPRALAMSKSNDPSGTALRILEHPRLAWLIRKLAVVHVVREYRQSARLHARLQGMNSNRGTGPYCPERSRGLPVQGAAPSFSSSSAMSFCSLGWRKL